MLVEVNLKAELIIYNPNTNKKYISVLILFFLFSELVFWNHYDSQPRALILWLPLFVWWKWIPVRALRSWQITKEHITSQHGSVHRLSGQVRTSSYHRTPNTEERLDGNAEFSQPYYKYSLSLPWTGSMSGLHFLSHFPVPFCCQHELPSFFQMSQKTRRSLRKGNRTRWRHVSKSRPEWQ